MHITRSDPGKIRSLVCRVGKDSIVQIIGNRVGIKKKPPAFNA
jgi:hypothetical protein